MSTPQYQSYGGTTARTDSSPASRLEVFKKPPDPDLLAKVRKRKVKVLDEDEFVERVEKIIERDFFPELDKLKAQNEYLEAKSRGDFATMNRLQEKYSGCRPGTGESGFGGPGGRRMTSPATFETPEEPRRETDPRRPEPGSSGGAGTSGKSGESIDDEGEKETENLDKFLANHTSEDNESFFALQKEMEKKHRIKNAWMYKDEKLFLEQKAKEMELPSIEDQAALTEKPLQLESWTYQNINSVFHNPDTLELSYEEKLDLAKKQKEIKHGNTRLSKVPWKNDKQSDLLRREAERQREIVSGKVGADGKEIVRPETPSVGGYKLMKMAPSPALGVTDSPLMTWGEVESTPFRLEGGAETPLFPIAGAGKGFSIAEVPERDRIAKELADRNSRYYRERKAKALEQVKTSMKAGRPSTGGTRPGSGLPNLSPAARRLVSGKLGIRLGTDDMLRASYTPTPGRSRSSSTPTPSKFVKTTPTPSKKSTKTPRSSVSSAASTPTIKAARKTDDVGGDITDNLLNLPASTVKRRKGPPSAEEKLDVSTDNLLNISGGGGKRARAHDFFNS